MAVIGSFDDVQALSKARISLMNREIMVESLEKLQELIRKRTPVDSGRLWDSIEKSTPKRLTATRWHGEVFTTIEYGPAQEYGMSPHYINPKAGGVLKWRGAAGEAIFATTVHHPGYGGHHMFQKGSYEFEKFHARKIVAKNAAKWLGAVDAGRRTIVT